jgi:hypothetical protein
MIVVRFVGARGTNGMIDASTTPDPDTPRVRDLSAAQGTTWL